MLAEMGGLLGSGDYDYVLTVQPIQVCATTNGCANPDLELRLEWTQAIWDQAGIRIEWLPWSTFTSNVFFNVGNPPYLATFDNLTSFPAIHGGSTAAKVVNMWFVNDLRIDGTGQDAAGLTFGSSIIVDEQGVARKDTIAHELGHSLGLDHVSSPENNLMRVSRTQPASIDDIVNGVTSQLTADQITEARSSSLLTLPISAPSIVSEPTDEVIALGTRATLSVQATGDEPLTYQWFAGETGDDSVPLDDAVGATFITPELTVDTVYWVRVSNSAGSVDSRTVTVTVLDPPQITAEPPDQTVATGSTATLSVQATGAEPLTYQWYTGLAGDESQPIAGATDTTFVTTELTADSVYWVRVSNAVGTADSRTVTLTVLAPPQITDEPPDQTVAAGSTATLIVQATGAEPLTYQWYVGSAGDDSLPIDGATDAAFVTTERTTDSAYWVRVSNAVGTVDSRTVTLTVLDAPQITAEPLNQTVATGSTATLSVQATGAEPLTYQWYTGSAGDDSQPIDGATDTAFVTPELTTASVYWVRVSNTVGTADSRTVTVTVLDPPQITDEPLDQTVATGTTATLSFQVSGAEPLSYQWYVGVAGDESQPIEGATDAAFVTPELNAEAAYWVRVSNAVGTVDSRTVTVTVLAPPQITDEPLDQTVATGSTATLSFQVSGAEPLTYQWYAGAAGDDSQPIDGAADAAFVTPELTTASVYWVRVSNTVGTADSRTVTVSVLDPPQITGEPPDQTVATGSTATLSVQVTGAEPGTYQWYTGVAGDEAQPIEGATDAAFVTPELTTASDYWVRVSNAVGTADSRTVTVSVVPVTLEVVAYSDSTMVVALAGPPGSRWTFERLSDDEVWQSVEGFVEMDPEGRAEVALPTTGDYGLYRAVLLP